MKKLIIISHPSSKWFSHHIAWNYIKWSQENQDETFLIDLYDKEYKQDFLEYEDLKDIQIDEKTKRIQEKISWADEIVFISPIWWFDCTAIMKNFFDKNFTSWFAFKYENWKPVWLLSWKSARVFFTADWPSFLYKMIYFVFFVIWKFWRLWFCGIKVKTIKIFWEMIKKSPEDREKITKYVYELWKK